MKQILLSTAVALALAFSAGQSDAANVKITTEMASFNGPRAYVAVYLTDPNGKVYDTYYVGGGKDKYYKHLRDWTRGANRSKTPAHAVTGASIGSGRTITVSADIADNLIAAGYQVRVDTAVEDKGDYPRSAVLTLGKQPSVAGRGIVRSLRVD